MRKEYNDVIMDRKTYVLEQIGRETNENTI